MSMTLLRPTIRGQIVMAELVILKEMTRLALVNNSDISVLHLGWTKWLIR